MTVSGVQNSYSFNSSYPSVDVRQSQAGSEAVDETASTVTGDKAIDKSGKTVKAASETSETKKATDKKVNEKDSGTKINFKVHKETGVTMIQIVDSSGKVIREIPPEKMLDTISSILKNAGIIVDKKI